MVGLALAADGGMVSALAVVVIVPVWLVCGVLVSRAMAMRPSVLGRDDAILGMFVLVWPIPLLFDLAPSVIGRWVRRMR